MTSGGADGVSVSGSLTKGGKQGTNGGNGVVQSWRDPRLVAATAFIAFGFVYMVVNAASLIDQRQALGLPIATWEAWGLEGSSFAAWLLLLPLVLWIAERFAKHKLWQAAAGHLAACFLVSLAHSAIMASIRVAIFSWMGSNYAPAEPIGVRLVFELRKDVITYVSILAVFLIARRFTSMSELVGSVSTSADDLIEVRDGSRVVMLRPEEIEWIEAAGNYVELHGAFGSELARRTLADFAKELDASGFVRVHRSRLVRRAAINTITTRQSGDFHIQLRSGATIGGSRRYRQNLL